jgi:hypothetical protein
LFIFIANPPPLIGKADEIHLQFGRLHVANVIEHGGAAPEHQASCGV